MHKNTARPSALRKWPPHRWNCGRVVPGLGEGEQTQFLGSVDLELAEQKHEPAVGLTAD